MKAECTHCHEEYEFDNRFHGQKVKCPNCGGCMEIINSNLFPCPDCFALISKRAEVCPKCGSKNLTKIDRMNGYLSYSRVHGDTRLNDAKMAEIAERKSM